MADENLWYYLISYFLLVNLYVAGMETFLRNLPDGNELQFIRNTVAFGLIMAVLRFIPLDVFFICFNKIGVEMGDIFATIGCLLLLVAVCFASHRVLQGEIMDRQERIFWKEMYASLYLLGTVCITLALLILERDTNTTARNMCLVFFAVCCTLAPYVKEYHLLLLTTPTIHLLANILQNVQPVTEGIPIWEVYEFLMDGLFAA